MAGLDTRSTRLNELAAKIPAIQLPILLKTADNLVAKHFGTSVSSEQRALIQFAVLQAHVGLQAVMSDPRVKAITSHSVTAYGNIQKMTKTFQSGEKLDASGITDIAGMCHQITGTLVDVFEGFELWGSGTSEEIKSWSQTAVNCTAAVATMGPYAGGAACALNVIGKLIEAIAGKDAQAVGPRALFVPSKEQLAVIGVDAARLAAVLRYWYGIQSYKSILHLVTHNAYLSSTHYPRKQTQKPLVAVDMRTIIAALTKYTKEDWAWRQTASTLVYAADNELGGHSGRGIGDRSLASTYVSDHDVNVLVIKACANLARAHLSNLSAWIPPGTPIVAGQIMASFGDAPLELHAFLRAEELINYFAAISKVEHLGGGGRWAAVHNNYLASDLPFRMAYVSDTEEECNLDWEDCWEPSQAPFGARSCWSSLDKQGIWISTYAANCLDLLRGHINAKKQEGYEELAFIRLICAWSYIHMVYMSTYGLLNSKGQDVSSDMIADVGNPSDPAAMAMRPVNPRQLVWDANQKAWFSRYQQGGTTTTSGAFTFTIGSVVASALPNIDMLVQHIQQREKSIGAIIADAQSAAKQSVQITAPLAHLFEWKSDTKSQGGDEAITALAIGAGLGLLLFY